MEWWAVCYNKKTYYSSNRRSYGLLYIGLCTEPGVY